MLFKVEDQAGRRGAIGVVKNWCPTGVVTGHDSSLFVPAHIKTGPLHYDKNKTQCARQSMARIRAPQGAMRVIGRCAASASRPWRARCRLRRGRSRPAIVRVTDQTDVRASRSCSRVRKSCAWRDILAVRARQSRGAGRDDWESPPPGISSGAAKRKAAGTAGSSRKPAPTSITAPADLGICLSAFRDPLRLQRELTASQRIDRRNAEDRMGLCVLIKARRPRRPERRVAGSAQRISVGNRLPQSRRRATLHSSTRWSGMGVGRWTSASPRFLATSQFIQTGVDVVLPSEGHGVRTNNKAVQQLGPQGVYFFILRPSPDFEKPWRRLDQTGRTRAATGVVVGPSLKHGGALARQAVGIGNGRIL